MSSEKKTFFVPARRGDGPVGNSKEVKQCCVYPAQPPRGRVIKRESVNGVRNGVAFTSRIDREENGWHPKIFLPSLWRMRDL